MLPRYNRKSNIFYVGLSLLLILHFVLRTSALQAANNSNATFWIGNATLEIKNFTSSLGPWSIYLAIILLFAFASLPILWNIKGYYNHLRDVRDLLKDKLSQGCNQAELIQLVKDALVVQSSGMQGVARATMALTLSVILGAAIFLLIANPFNLDETKLDKILPMLKDIMLALTGAISSIIGFYFGGRATQSAEPQNGGGGSATVITDKPNIEEFATEPEPPAKPGKVKLFCSATNPSKGFLQYKFEVLDKDGKRIDGTPGYQNQNEWVWNAEDVPVGNYLLWVYVRDGLHADIGGYDARAKKKFEIKNE